MKRLLFILIFIGLIFAPLSIDSYELSSSKLRPGQDGSIKITLKNIQPSGVTTIVQSINNVNVYYTPTEGIEIKSTNPITMGTIQGGSTAIVTVPIKILPNTKGGIVVISFSIKQENGDTQSLNVPVQILNPPILTVSTDKQTIGSTDVLNVTIKNNGGSANKLVVKLNSTDKFSFSGTDQIFVGDVKDSKTFSMPIDSRNADEGVNFIPLIFTYEQEGGDSTSEDKPISVTIKKEKADVVFTQEALIVTSIDGVLKLKVKNIGRPLIDFRVILEDENIKAKETKEIKLGDFNTGDEKTISINIFADTKPGVQNTKIKLKWLEEDVEKEEEISVPIAVSSDADVGIFIDSKPSPLTSGGEHTLSVLISNIGSYRIENVEVSLEEGDILYILNAQKSQYIGKLESDDFSTVQYKVRIKNIPAGTHPLSVIVKYKDQSGIWIQKNVTSSIVIRPAEEAGKKNGNVLFYVIPTMLILAFAYWYFRKRKKQQSVAK